MGYENPMWRMFKRRGAVAASQHFGIPYKQFLTRMFRLSMGFAPDRYIPNRHAEREVGAYLRWHGEDWNGRKPKKKKANQ